MIADPPFDAGAVNATAAPELDCVTVVIVGAPGTVRGVTDPLVTEAEFPCELAETTENV